MASVVGGAPGCLVAVPWPPWQVPVVPVALAVALFLPDWMALAAVDNALAAAGPVWLNGLKV